MNVLKSSFISKFPDMPEQDSEARVYLLENGVSDTEIVEVVKKILNLDYLTDYETTLDMNLYRNLDKSVFLANRIAPVSIEGGKVLFVVDGHVTRAFRNLADTYAKQMNVNSGEIRYVMFKEDFDTYIDTLFSSGNTLNVNSADRHAREELLANTDRTKKGLVFADYVLNRGFDLRSSDIHIEPSDEGTLIRYRVDGQLSVREVFLEDQIPHRQLINTLMFRASMDPSDSRKGQDGRIQDMEHKGSVYDVRVSTISSVSGIKMVLRILEKSSNIPSLKELGFSNFYVDSIVSDVSRNHGLVLYTGSVGSGKSTTQRTLLVNSDPFSKNVYSIEDPVERTIPYVNHVCVHTTNIGFEEHLETLLRQDPDIIAIGEIRNRETMDMALKAALSGQLVFATLHTNSAIEAFYRLFNMGIEPYELGAALNGISSQRLIRKLCPYCRSKRKTTDPEKALIRGMLSRYSRFSSGNLNKFEYIHDPVGCSHCNNTGYYGRTVVGEYLSTTDAIKTYISTGDVSRDDLLDLADDAFVPIEVDALNKLTMGNTSLAEIIRVL